MAIRAHKLGYPISRGEHTEAKKIYAEKSSSNNQMFCSQRKLSLFYTKPQSST